MLMSKISDISGQTFGDLLVLNRAEDYVSPKGQKKRQWLCSCICGETVVVQVNNLKTGNTTSCGCSWKKPYHGMSDTLTYTSYDAMMARCFSSNEAFSSYQRKGITVDPRWVEDFLVFLEEMGERPTKYHWLDRINPDLGYCKENCRWNDDKNLNFYNTSLRENNTSGRTGVSYYEQTDKWAAYIGFEGKHIKLGYFVQFEDAVKAREIAEIKYYGFNKK